MIIDDVLDFGERWAFVPQLAAFGGIVWQGWSNPAVRGLAIFLLATVVPTTIKAWRRRSINKYAVDLEVTRFDIRYQHTKSKTLFDIQAHVKITNRHEDRGLERWHLLCVGKDGSPIEIEAGVRQTYIKKNEAVVTPIRTKFEAAPDLPEQQIKLRLTVTGAKPITLTVDNPTPPPHYVSPQ